MRKLFFDPHVKLAFVSGIYTLFLLLIIPKITINLTYKFIKINSSIGGYEFSLLGKAFDFSSFKKGLEFGGGTRLSFQVPVADIGGTKETLVSRAKLLKIYDYKISSHVSDDLGFIDLAIPHLENAGAAESFLTQRGFLVLRALSKETVWDEANSEEYFYDPSYWQDTGLDSTEIQSVTILGKSEESVSSQFQINLTSEGQSIFGDIARNNVRKPIALYLDDSPFPISMPLVGEDLADAPNINPVVTSSISQKDTKLFVKLVNSGVLPSDYEFAGSEDVAPVYERFSTRLFALSAVLGFVTAFLFVFLIYGKFGFVFLPSLFIQFLSSLFLLKVFSVYLNFEVILMVSLSLSLYFIFGVLVLSQLDKPTNNPSFLSIYISDAFKNAVKIIKPYFVILTFGVLAFYLVEEVKDFSLIRDLAFGYLSSYVAFLTFRLFANLFWAKKIK